MMKKEKNWNGTLHGYEKREKKPGENFLIVDKLMNNVNVVSMYFFPDDSLSKSVHLRDK